MQALLIGLGVLVLLILAAIGLYALTAKWSKNPRTGTVVGRYAGGVETIWRPRSAQFRIQRPH